MLKFSANLSMLFPEYPFIQRFQQAKQLGFEYYEMQFPYDYSVQDIQREATGMQCDLINSYIGVNDGFGYASIPGAEKKFDATLEKISDFHNGLHMKKVHFIAGLKSPQFKYEEQLNTYVKSLQKITDFLDHRDMIGLIEPICPEVKKGYFLDSFDLAVEVLNKVNRKNIKLLLDIYHLHKITGDVKGSLAKYYPYAGHVQISQDPGRFEPFHPDGKIDYEYVFEFLIENGHQDVIGLEYCPSGSTEASLKWMDKFKPNASHN